MISIAIKISRFKLLSEFKSIESIKLIEMTSTV